jgi:hypothetical protein
MPRATQPGIYRQPYGAVRYGYGYGGAQGGGAAGAAAGQGTAAAGGPGPGAITETLLQFLEEARKAVIEKEAQNQWAQTQEIAKPAAGWWGQ